MDFGYSQEELALKNRVRNFAQEKLLPIRDRIDSIDDYSPEAVKLLAEEGLYRYVVPKEYGGLGISSVAVCIIREELARVCTQADVAFIMSLFASQGIVAYGTEKQKEHYLPQIAIGECCGTAAITEPGCGSDISAISTKAKPEGEYYILNGVKSFCSMGSAAKACVVIATVDSAMKEKGISAFIVDCMTPQPGMQTKIMQIVAPHPVYRIEFTNYRLPRKCILGQEGQGIMVCLSMLGRCRTTVASAALGIAVSAYEETCEWVEKRIAFERPIIKFQSVQLMLADMLVDIEATRLLALRAAWVRDHEDSEESLKQASIAKLFGTEAAQRVVDLAVQIHGGFGVLRGGRVEYLYRAIRALRIYEGTSEISVLLSPAQIAT